MKYLFFCCAATALLFLSSCGGGSVSTPHKPYIPKADSSVQLNVYQIKPIGNHQVEIVPESDTANLIIANPNKENGMEPTTGIFIPGLGGESMEAFLRADEPLKPGVKFSIWIGPFGGNHSSGHDRYYTFLHFKNRKK